MADALPQILIRGHLGLGDHLVLNAIVRHYAQSHTVFLPCKRHNCVSVNFMMRDLPNVTVLPVADDKEADELCRLVANRGHRVLRLGMFGNPPYSPLSWDRDSYRQAGVPFEHRWTEWQCVRDLARELPVYTHPSEYCFIHEDQSRGFVIDRTRLPQDMPLVFVEPGVTQNLFDWWGFIERATELHLIDSCFAILADSLPELKARRKVIHLYARQGAEPPSYQKDWEILK